MKRKTEITEADVFLFKPEWREKWKEWVVIDDGFPCGSYDTKEEAEKKARLHQKAKDTIEDIRGTAESILEELTEEEKEFLREYTGGTIEIEI